MKTKHKASTIGGIPTIQFTLASGTQVQFATLGTGILMGMKPAGRPWTNTMVRDAERFGPFATAKQLEQWVANFEAAAVDEFYG